MILVNFNEKKLLRLTNNDLFSSFRPEVKEGKEGETEKTAEQENNESDKIEKELEKDKVKDFVMKNCKKINYFLIS